MALKALETKFNDYLQPYTNKEGINSIPENCQSLHTTISLGISDLKKEITQEELIILKDYIIDTLAKNTSKECDDLINLTKELLVLVSGKIVTKNTSSRKSRYRKALKSRKARKDRKTRKAEKSRNMRK
jgi:hypothetical protein